MPTCSLPGAPRRPLPAAGGVTFEQIYLRSAGMATCSATLAAPARASGAARRRSRASWASRPCCRAHGQRCRSTLVARDFRCGVCDAAAQLPLGEWPGPVRSAFGRIWCGCRARTRGGACRRWTRCVAQSRAMGERAPRRRARASSYAALRERYEVVHRGLRAMRCRAVRDADHALSLSARRLALPAAPTSSSGLPASCADRRRHLRRAVEGARRWTRPTTLKLQAVLPAGYAIVTPLRGSFAAGMTVQRWRMRVRAGWRARRSISPACRRPRIDVLVRVERARRHGAG